MLHAPLVVKGGLLVGLLAIVATEALVVSASAQWALTAGIGITAAVSIATGYFQVIERRDRNRRADRDEEIRLEKEKKDEDNRKAEKSEREAVASKAEEAARLAAKAAVKVEEVATLAAKAAVNVAEVKTNLEATDAATSEKLDGLAKVAGASHIMLNKRFGVQLELTATAKRELANAVPTPEHTKAAEAAEKEYTEHIAAQAEVDSKFTEAEQKRGQ